MKKQRWINDARKAWKLHSVWFSGVAATVAAIAAGVWQTLTVEEQNAVLEHFGVSGIFKAVAAAFATVIILRLKNQTPPPVPPCTPSDPSEEETK